MNSPARETESSVRVRRGACRRKAVLRRFSKIVASGLGRPITCGNIRERADDDGIVDETGGSGGATRKAGRLRSMEAIVGRLQRVLRARRAHRTSRRGHPNYLAAVLRRQ